MDGSGTSSTFTAPDGSRVTISGSPLVASRQWNCPFVAQILGVRHPFTVAGRGTVDKYAARWRTSDLDSHPYQSADLLLGHDAENAEAMAAWRGEWHELLTFRSGPRLGPASFIRTYDAFRIVDTPDGLLVRARSARRVAFEPPRVFKEIPGLGDLRIQRPHESDVPVPQWRGASARSGEIWRRSFTDGGETGRARSESLVLATATAVTELLPGPHDTADSDAAANFLANLDVVWTPA